MKKIVKNEKVGESFKDFSVVSTCEKVSKISLYLLAFLLPLIFLPWTANVLEFNKQALLIVLAFVSVFAWFLKILISGKARFNLSYVHIPVGVLFLVYLVSTIFSSARYGSFWGWPQVTSESLISLLCLALVYILIVNIFEKKEIFYLLSALIFSGALAGLYGILQIFGSFIIPIGFTKINTFNTIGSISNLGFFVAVLLPVSVMLFVISKKNIYRILFIASAVIFTFLLLLINFHIFWWLMIAGSALIFAFGMQRRDVFDSRWLIVPMFLLSVGLLFAFFRFSIPGMPQGAIDPYLRQNFTLDMSLKALQENPVIGTGPGTFVYSFLKYKTLDINQTDLWNVSFSWGSSKFLTVLSTVGVLGGLAFLALIGFFIFYGIKFLFKKKEIEDNGFYWNLGAGLFIGFLTLSLGYFLYSSNLTLDFVYFVFMGCFVALLYRDKKEFELKPSSLLTLGFTFGITIIFVFGLGLFIMEGQRYVSAKNYLDGTKLWQEGETDLALVKLEKAVNVSPSVDLYWRSLSQAYLQNIAVVANREDFSDDQKRQLVQILINNSVNAAKESSDKNSADVANWSNRGLVYQNLVGMVSGAKDWAVSAYKEAMVLDPTNPIYPTQAGVSVLSHISTLAEDNPERAELFVEAEDWFNKAIELKPDYATAHFQLSQIYLVQGKESEMIESLENAKQSAPFDVGLAFQLGLVYHNKKDFAKAKTELERAVLLNPDYSNALYFLGISYYELGEKDSAVKALERVLALNPGNETATKVLNNMRAGRKALDGLTEEEPPVIPIEEETEE